MSKSLGRGLSSLIPDQNSQQQRTIPDMTDAMSTQSAEWLSGARTRILEVSPQSIVANPYQPRQTFQDEALKDLMDSIKEHGILQPLVVTEKEGGSFELVAGERRLRAAQTLRLKTVPVIVRNAGELEKLELSLIENIQRQDLNAIERAVAYKKLIDEFSLTHEQAAKRMGKSRPVISNALRLLELPAKVQQMIANGILHESAALAVLEAGDAKQQLELAEQIAASKLTKDEARRLVRQKTGQVNKGSGRSANPVIASFKRELEGVLQTKVSIGRRGKTGWQINIEAYSLEELKALIEKITGSR